MKTKEYRLKSLRISFALLWFDLWIGAFWDQKQRTLYVCPLPCLVVKIRRFVVPTFTTADIKFSRQYVSTAPPDFLKGIEPEVLKSVEKELQRQMKEMDMQIRREIWRPPLASARRPFQADEPRPDPWGQK